MRLQNIVLTTNVAGIKILTCTNEDIMDNMKLYLRQGVSQYTVTGVKTGNMYKFTFPVLDFGIVRMQFVSTRGTQVRASTIFSTMIEDNVVSEPGNEYAKATDLTAVDDKYKIITDNLTGSLNLHKTNYNTFHDDQIIFNNNTTTDISNYKLTTNTSITNINTTLNGMYTKTEVNTLISNTNSSVDTKLQSYYNKAEVDNKLATLDLTNYAPKSTVYTKSETNALFTPYYTKTNVDDKFVLYYTKSNVDSLFANDRLSNDGRYVLKDVYDTYTSTIYTKTEIDNKVSNINTQITGLTNNINTLNITVGDNYTTLDDKYVALNTKVENYNRNSTASFAKMDLLDLVSTNDYKIGDIDNGFPVPHRDGYRRTPDGLMERWFYLNINIIKLIPLKPEEIVTDESSQFYNIKYKTEFIDTSGEESERLCTVMIVDLGFTFTQIYDIDILYNSYHSYYSSTVVPENGILTEDGKLKLLLPNGFYDMVTDNNGVLDPNSDYIKWSLLDVFKITKVRILGRAITDF